MKHFALILLFFTFITSFSQVKTIKHVVAKGESVYQISKKYNVTQNDIFKLNPSAKNKLKLNTVLLIPSLNTENVTLTHEVLPKETLYGISKKYQVSIDDIKKANPIIEKEGLEIGLQLKIPSNGLNTNPSDMISENSEQEEISHLVLPKETKYGLAKKYKTTIAELVKLNPEIVNELSIGAKIIIRNGKNKKETYLVDKDKSAISKSAPEQQKPEPTVNENIVKDSIIENKPKDVLSQTVAKDSIAETKPNLENLALADKLVVIGSENIGTRYRSGGTQKGGFDCSGLMIFIYSNTDVKLPRTSNEMSRFGENVNKENAQKGDLIFFATGGPGRVNHVGMITEVLEDEIKFIHSSVHAGVIISSTKEAYYSKRFVKINKVL